MDSLLEVKWFKIGKHKEEIDGVVVATSIDFNSFYDYIC
jgi:hypothetical protein